MKKYIYILASFIIVTVWLCAPVAAWAASLADLAPPLAPLLITEVQMGSAASASEEFIEFLNTTKVPINLSAHTWQLQIASSTAADWSVPLRTLTLGGILQPGAYYVVASQYNSGGQQVQYLPDKASLWFSAGLSAGAGHVRLVYEASQTHSGGCVLTATTVDELEWSTTKDGTTADTSSLDGRPPYLASKSTGVPAGSSLQRYITRETATYSDRDNDMMDFIATAPASPGAANTTVIPSIGNVQPVAVLPADSCGTAVPPGGNGVEPGQGSGTGDPPSGDTGGTSGGDTGTTSNDPGGGAEDPAPTPSNALLPPRLSELLPNPAAPQTDAADEYIELYNPNEADLNISGYVLTVGTTTTHSFTFPAGTLLPAGAYTAFFSAVTGLSLSNSGGQAQLTDRQGLLLAQTAVYDAAKDGQAWAFINGVWEWTDTPTPNAPNLLGAPPVTAATTTATVKSAATTRTAAKNATTTAAVKAPKVSTAKPKTATAKAKKPTAKTPKTTTFATATASNKSSLHPVILATVVLLAVLYGAYEYRHDMANHIRRFRDNREHRRKNRPAPTRRRND